MMSDSSAAPQTQVVSLSLEAELAVASQQLQSGQVSIEDIDSSRTSNGGVASFVESYEAELDRTSDALTAAAYSIETDIHALLLHADALARSHAGDDRDGAVAALQARAKSLAGRSLLLHAQVAADAAELRRVAALADDRLGLSGGAGSVRALAEQRLARDPWTMADRGGGIDLVLMSDVYTAIRELEEERLGGDKKWVAPSSFERVTTKYWVKEEDLYQVVLASVADQPMLVYGKKGGRILAQGQSTLDGGGSIWTSSLSTPITSVYFDSPNMDMYNERIKRSEGAQLFRIRWYGPNKPSGAENVFLELKTHHEGWIGNKSVKERVTIHEEDVVRLMDVDDVSPSWDEQTAIDMVRKANPTEKEEAIAKLAELLLRIRALMVKLRLTPCVRTKYTRVALQSATSNQCRLTIDKDVRIINERGSEAKSSWCLGDDDPISKHNITKLPYGVYEVKVSGEGGDPGFVTDLEEREAIVKAQKFSKFLSGASVYNADAVNMLPWWSTEPAFIPFYQEKHGGRGLRWSLSDRFATATDETGAGTTSLDSPLSSEKDLSSEDATSNLSLLTPLLANSNKNRPDAQPARRSYAKSEAKGFRQRVLRRVNPAYYNKKNRVVAPKTRLRVSPNAYFANERTFIQWVGAGLIFVAGDIYFNIQGTLPKWTFVIPLFMIVYAIVVYYRRIYLMRNGKNYGYADFFGPAFLATLCIIMIIVQLVSLPQPQTPPPAAKVATVSLLTHKPGQCVRRFLGGAPPMETQPSGVVVDEKNGLLLVPSLNRILGLKDGLPTEEENAEGVQIVAELPGKNVIKALEYVGDSIFALTESGSASEIISLEWVSENLQQKGGNQHLQEVHHWDISTTEAEGMALVASGKEKGSLLTNLATAGETIDVFDMALFSIDNTIEKISMMNKKWLSKGLECGKVDSMQYFEGLLYVLFSSNHVIRAFDTKTATLVWETRLPMSALGSGSQWKGMHLQRINREESIANHRLRGSGPLITSLVLHLTLDAPAQVWTLLLDEDEVDGRQWALPDCAG